MDFNIKDLSAMDAMVYGNSDDDADLEAELLALEAEEAGIQLLPPQRKVAQNHRQARSAGGSPFTEESSAPKAKKTVVEIEKFASNLDEDLVLEDEDFDENDPELLAELDHLTEESPATSAVRKPAQSFDDLEANENDNKFSHKAAGGGGAPSIVSNVSGSSLVAVLEERLKAYQQAETAAKQAGEAAKCRRFQRGIQTLQQQLKVARTGKAICEDDIPPPIASGIRPPGETSEISAPKSSLTLPAQTMAPAISSPSLVPTSAEKKPMETSPKPISIALPPVAPRPMPAARSKVDPKVVENLRGLRDDYKKAALLGKQANDRETAVHCYKVAKSLDDLIEGYQTGKTVDLNNLPPRPNFEALAQAGESPSPSAPQRTPESVEKEIFKAPAAPTNVMEALQQRLEKYKVAVAQSRQEGNEAKARRMLRIQQQYEEAIKLYKAGKAINFEELPTPPGFAPIPGVGQASTPPPLPSRQHHVVTPPSPGQKVPSPAGSGAGKSPAALSGGPTPPKMSKQEAQLRFLLERQQKFKEAAVTAKKKGDLESAMSYLRQAKGFDQMIHASRNGLPVDITQCPIPPQLRPSSIKLPVGQKSNSPVATLGSPDEIYMNLERDLIRQFQLCAQNSELFTKLGDVTKATMFDRLADAQQKDLIAMKNAKKHGQMPPKFHYEMRKFPVLQSNLDLSENDLEISVIRGLQIRPPQGYEPKDMDVFVKFTIPYPQETPLSGKTESVKGTNSPKWEHRQKFNIDRKSRQLLRAVKLKGIKFEVFQRGGFMRSDKLLGSFEVKMADLETKAEIHESFDLLEGRKQAGGKVEVKIRMRDALGQKQYSETQEKWLVIDG